MSNTETHKRCSRRVAIVTGEIIDVNGGQFMGSTEISAPTNSGQRSINTAVREIRTCQATLS